MRELPTAILLDPNDGSLRVARALGRLGVRVHVLARPRNAHIARSRYVHGRVLPPPAVAPAQWLEAIVALAGLGPGVLLPGSDDTSELLVHERARIPAELRSFEAEDGHHLLLMDKARLYELAAELGIRTPWRRSIAAVADLAECGELSYPCVAKPALSHVGKAAGGFVPQLVHDRAELEQLCHGALAAGVEMLVSEWVPGGNHELEASIMVRLADGSYPLVYGRRKLRQYPTDLGTGSILRSSTAVEETIEMTRRICDAVGYVGIANLEAKRHPLTGERVLIEINVRIPGGFALGDACGVDASWRLYAALAGLALGPHPRMRDGVQFVSPVLEALALRELRREGRLRPREVLASYRGTRDAGILNLDDPMPAIELLRQQLRARRHPGGEPRTAVHAPMAREAVSG